MSKRSQKPPVHVPGGEKRDGAFGWSGVVEWTSLDADVTVLFYSTGEVGVGPSWHTHPYDEVFVIRSGRARFTIGDTVIDAGAGDIVTGPASIPHKYHNLGPGPLETTDIHLSPEWIQTDLEDPEEVR